MTDQAQTQAPNGIMASRADLWRAVTALRDGQVVAVPTDTVYGLVALADSEAAIQQIFDLKRRPQTNPLPVLLGSAAELPLVARNIPELVWPCIRAFWPGSLTIILESATTVSRIITAGTGRIGIRVPTRSAVLDLLEAVEFPLASTSANLTGMPPAASQAELLEQLGPSVYVFDGGGVHPPATGHASTVVDLTSQPVLVRRRGEITPDQLRKALATRVEIAPGA